VHFSYISWVRYWSVYFQVNFFENCLKRGDQKRAIILLFVPPKSVNFIPSGVIFFIFFLPSVTREKTKNGYYLQPCTKQHRKQAPAGPLVRDEFFIKKYHGRDKMMRKDLFLFHFFFFQDLIQFCRQHGFWLRGFQP